MRCGRLRIGNRGLAHRTRLGCDDFANRKRDKGPMDILAVRLLTVHWAFGTELRILWR